MVSSKTAESLHSVTCNKWAHERDLQATARTAWLSPKCKNLQGKLPSRRILQATAVASARHTKSVMCDG
eukprot:6121495-Amphidinium_carterae.1